MAPRPAVAAPLWDRSRVHPTYKTYYRVGNWRAYEHALVSRGDDTSDSTRPKPRHPPRDVVVLARRQGCVERATVRSTWRAAAVLGSGNPDRLDTPLVFHLPLRQTEGFVRSILTMMRAGLDAPDHTILSRRSQTLDVAAPSLAAKGPLHLIVDSTGLSVMGEGEWAAAKHGSRGTRGWKKLHLGVDGSGVIVAHVLTHATG